MCWMAWYWRNLANGPVTPAMEMVRHSDTGDQAGWPGVKLIPTHLTISTSSAGDFGEKSWFLLIAWTLLCKYCHQASQKYLLPRVWRKVCSMADTNKFKVPCLIPASRVRFVTELQSTNTGPGADCWHPPPWQGVGAACVCYKDQQMVSADTADRSDSWGVDQTFQLWLAAWWIFDICGHL